MFDTGEPFTAAVVGPEQGVGLPALAGRGPELAATLAGLDPRLVSDHGLVEVARAARALTSWVQSLELSVVAELADRPAVRGEFAADEVAAGLTLTRRAANAWVSLAFELCARLPGTLEALRAGRIDLAKARVIAAAAATLDDGGARQLEEAVLAAAPGLTTGQLVARAGRAALSIDPESARERHERTRRDRRVEFGPGVDGTADLYGLCLDPDAAAAAYARIDAHARSAKAARDTARAAGYGTGDERGMDEFRADAYVDLLLGTGLYDPKDIAPTRGGDGASDGNTGEHDAGEHETGEHETGEHETGEHEAGEAAAWAYHGECSRGETDVGKHDADGNSAGTAGDAETQAPSVGYPYLPAAPSPAARIGLTVPLTTLLGLADEPGDLAGYGPVISDITRRVAAAATGPADQWCWTVTDEAGRVLHHGRTAYRPTGALRDLIEARDRTCRAFGCRQPAARCDVDHTTPHTEGGFTCPCNTGLLCRHHHRMKHRGGWDLRQTHPGTFVWTSPTGHTYTREPGNDQEAGPAP